jgi:restriction endonuclease Mrr
MIPDYQTVMLPLLKYLSDGEPHSKTEATVAMGKYFYQPKMN